MNNEFVNVVRIDTEEDSSANRTRVFAGLREQHAQGLVDKLNSNAEKNFRYVIERQ